MLGGFGESLEMKDSRGRPAMILAVEHGHAALASALLAKGADIEAKDDEGKSSLIFAAEHGRVSLIKFLLASGGISIIQRCQS